MSVSECNKLASRFEALANRGLVDVKFYVRALDEATTDKVCGEVNALYDALDNGRSESLNFGDSHRAA